MNEEFKIEELKKATRLANEVLKDLKQERKEATELVKNYIAKVEKDIGEGIIRQLDELSKVTQNAMDASVTRVFKKFDELAALLMGETKNELSIPELVKYRQSLKESK